MSVPGESAGKAITAMLVATLCYLLGDTIVKLATESVPITQIIFVRGAIAILIIVASCAAAGVLVYFPKILHPLVLLRGLFDGVTTLLFTNALANMRIADATAIINAVPIVGALLAIVILKEKVTLARWVAIIGGFIGVLLVMRPEAGAFNLYGLLAVGSATVLAFREVVTRRIPKDIPALLVTLCSAITVTLAGGLFSFAGSAWRPLALSEIAFIGCASFFLFGAYHFSVLALRSGEVSMVGPFRYMIIVWSLLVGYLVWGDVPDWIVASGMALIVAAGLVVVRSEMAAARRR